MNAAQLEANVAMVTRVNFMMMMSICPLRGYDKKIYGESERRLELLMFFTFFARAHSLCGSK